MPPGTYREIIRHKGLQSFLWTQFLGAFNDNLFRIVVSLLAVQMASGASSISFLVASGSPGDFQCR